MLKRSVATAAKVAALSALLLCSAVGADREDNSSIQLRELVMDGRDAATAEDHHEMRRRLTAFAQQMESQAQEHHRAAAAMPEVPRALLEEQGVTMDPRTRKLRHARRLNGRAALARQLAAKHRDKAEDKQRSAEAIHSASN